MQSLNQSLAAAVTPGLIADQDAMEASLDKEDLRKCILEN
jgi:hypothetical protein